MKKLLLGNAAAARGLYEAGCSFVSSYPGTPSTEITEEAAKFPEVYAEWAPNEKCALEAALGASIAGARAMCAMKHVGLNVAADPLYTAAYTGVNGGLVIAVADDGVGMDEEVARRMLSDESAGSPTGSSKGTGIALRNVADRVELFYGEGSGVEIMSKVGSGTCVTCRSPSLRRVTGSRRLRNLHWKSRTGERRRRASRPDTRKRTPSSGTMRFSRRRLAHVAGRSSARVSTS